MRQTERTERLEELPQRFDASITDEERHGFPPDIPFHQVKSKQPTKRSFFQSSFFYQFFGSVVLFFASVIILKGNIPIMKQSETWVRNAYEEHLPFASMHDWYVQHLGIPLALVPQTETVSTIEEESIHMPLQGEVIESFHDNGTGIYIKPEEKSYVQAVNKGVVIFAGNKEETGQTIIIQHADRTETTYGHLSSIDVHLYKTVATDEFIGTIDPDDATETMFFSIEAKAGYVDPVKVINVDGTP